MASWGNPAVGGDRPTGLQPTRSAILGLLGAALGLKRDDNSGLRKLQKSVIIAVKQCVPSSLIRDYHTSQVPSNSNKIVHYSRKSELNETKLNTILSSRDYRCDGLWVVAIYLEEESQADLLELKNALLKPTYTLSLGRKSCPLGLPLAPIIGNFETLKMALDTEFPSITRSFKEDSLWLKVNGKVTYFWEGDKNKIPHDSIVSTTPWDEPINRERWQFTQLELHQLTLEDSNHVSI